jgi:hypothetical protein
MSFHAWLNSIAGVGFKKGDVNLGDELTGVQNYFNPSQDVYWNVRRQGPIIGLDGKPIEELSQVASMTEQQVQELLLRLIPEDIDPSTKLDRRAPLRSKLRAAIASLPKPTAVSRTRSSGGVTWSEDAEPQDHELWGTTDDPKSAEEIVKRSMVSMRKLRQQKREGKQREMRQSRLPQRESSSELNGTPRGQEHLQAAWEASTRPNITPGVGMLRSNQVGQPIRENLAVLPPELTDVQRGLLAEVQNRYGVPADRDKLYSAARQHLGEDLKNLPTKRQIAAHFLQHPIRDHARWNTSSLNGVLGHDEYMTRPHESDSDFDTQPRGECGAPDHRLGEGNWLGPEVDRLPLGGAPELEAAWIASVGPPKAQVEAARRATQRAAERGESGHWVRSGRSNVKRWVHDHDVPKESSVPHDDDWVQRQAGDDMSTHGHFSELMRAQSRNEYHMGELVDSWRAELQTLKRAGLRDRAAAEGVSTAQFEEAEGMYHGKNSHCRKAAVIDLIIAKLKANYLAREGSDQLDVGVLSRQRDSSRARSRAAMSSTAFDNGGKPVEIATVVRDVKELRRAVASKTGSKVVELAAGVAFVLEEKSLVVQRSLHLRSSAAGDKTQQPRLITRGLGFPAINASGIGCEVVLEGLRVETGGGRSQGAALRVTGGCSLCARQCLFHGSVVASGQQTSLRILQSSLEQSPAAGLSITDGANGLLEDSGVKAASGDGVYVSGDGKVAEVRRRKSETDTTGSAKQASKASEAALEALWQQAINYRLTTDREVESMRRNIARGRYSVSHYTQNWRRRLQKVEHGCTGDVCLVCRRDIVRQNLYGEETETLLVVNRSTVSNSSWNSVWVANGGRVVLEGGLLANSVLNCGRRDFVSSNGGQIDGLTDDSGNPLTAEELAEIVHTI